MKRDREEGPNGAELDGDATKRVKVEDGAEEQAARVPAPAGAAAGLPEQAPAAADQAHAAAEQAQAAVEQAAPAAEAPVEVKQEDEEDEDDHIALPRSTTRSAVKKGHECPYLDTISRQNLDFDFEKCCSVSLSPVNVYVCLVCGKYFQGRGLATHAYTHSLDTNHHMFMKVDNGKVYCLPDNYEVVDRSLDDIRYVLNPRLTREEVARLDKDVSWARALDGTEYMPGLVGLNNMKANDYANVIMQILARVVPIRDYFLVPENYAGCRSLLVQRFGELLRKIWNPRRFKGQVSPHEFMQAVIVASKKRFTIDAQSDPVQFWSWLLNSLHHDLTGGKVKRRSIITDCFQGELEVTTLKGTGKGKAATAQADVVERVPFLLLGLDLPPAPLFKDAMDKNIIPQVPIFAILSKYNGSIITDDIKAGRRTFSITRLPPFLTLHMRRFTYNNFFTEKNPTLVNFPVKNLELRDVLPLTHVKGNDGKPAPSKYDLIANVVHEGLPGQGQGGTYKAHIHRQVESQWYELQDLMVSDILPQMVALSEAYFQVYELKRSQPEPASNGAQAASSTAATRTAGQQNNGAAPMEQ